MTHLVDIAANDDEPNSMALLVFAIENVIDATVARLAAQGLSADRDRIREQLLHPDNRAWLLPETLRPR